MGAGFKEDLYGYFLEYTRKLLETIVSARDSDPDAKKLIDLVNNHTSGNGDIGDFNDADVIFNPIKICNNLILILEGGLHQ